MAGGYTRSEILKRCDAASDDIATFYKQPFVNYKGTTTDTDEFYTEIVAHWCLDNIDKFEAISKITRESSYNMDHDGDTDEESSSRNEERIAMELFRQSRDAGEFDHVGRIIDYQTPLKNKQGDSAGKIDLLSYDGKTLRILELKDEDSEETMLRCVLEGFTYFRTVDEEKLIDNFMDKLKSRPESFVACPLVFEGGYQQKSMEQDMPNLRELMKRMSGGAFYLSATKPYKIANGQACA